MQLTFQAAEVRRMLDLKLSNAAAAKTGAGKDEDLKRLNQREATAQAAKLRCNAAYFNPPVSCTIPARARAI